MIAPNGGTRYRDLTKGKGILERDFKRNLKGNSKGSFTRNDKDMLKGTLRNFLKESSKLLYSRRTFERNFKSQTNDVGSMIWRR